MQTIIDQSPEIDKPLQWVEKISRLDDLRPWENNPRTITEAQFRHLCVSLIQDGYAARIEATPDGRVISGHQRIKALRECAPVMGLDLDRLPILVPNRPLSDDEFYRRALRANHNNGVYDMDLLSALFDLEFLREGIGLHEAINIAPPLEGDQPQPKSFVKCPDCGSIFPTRGNKCSPP